MAGPLDHTPNGRVAKAAGTEQVVNGAAKSPEKRPAQQRRPDYAKIHAKPLPLAVYPLPAFVPHNPLSLLRIGYVLLTHLWSPPSSHQAVLYDSTFDTKTSGVHVTDPVAIRALWEHGFFGKGNLSRSEPNWLDQEKKRRGLIEGLTSEQITERRRRKRIEMKQERARKEREVLQFQMNKEEKDSGDAPSPPELATTFAEEAAIPQVGVRQSLDDATHDMLPVYSRAGLLSQQEFAKIFSAPTKQSTETVSNTNVKPGSPNGYSNDSTPVQQNGQALTAISDEAPGSADALFEGEVDIQNEEHLQLSLEEAFFCIYALGVLEIEGLGCKDKGNIPPLFDLFRSCSYFPPAHPLAQRMDDPFVVSYVVYHHFRSLGWVVRPANKFAGDFLLYKGGPVFSHAEFTVVVVPSYVHAYWFESRKRAEDTRKRQEENEWWWLHCVNRIQSHVIKTLVLAYVEIPPPSLRDGVIADVVGEFLGRYKVREVVLRRWTPNRARE